MGSVDHLSLRPVSAVRVHDLEVSPVLTAVERAPVVIDATALRPVDPALVPRRLVLSPALLAALQTVTTVAPAAGGAPLLDTRAGSVFHDAGDPTLLWYLPAYTAAPDPDASFAFAAQQGTVPDGEGHPSNSAALTLSLVRSVPADATAALAALPGGRLQEIPPVATEVTLTLPYRDDAGHDQQRTVPGTTALTDTGLVATFSGLLGDSVAIAYTDLATVGGATVTVRRTFLADRTLPPHRWFDDVRLEQVRAPVIARDIAVEGPPVGVAVRRTLRAETVSRIPVERFPVDRLPRDPAPVDPAPAEPTTVRSQATDDAVVVLGTQYATPAYRLAYTLQTKDGTHAIASLDDLEHFRGAQSEYVEITALGEVGARYPSLRALYAGSFSGQVVAVPAAYGIRRTQAGCDAACDALLDAGSAAGSGARFHLSFGLAPLVDPGDLARLDADLRATAVLADREWRVATPSDLDRRTAPSFSSPFASGAAFGVGTAPGTFRVGLDVTDDELPSVAMVNAFLEQLAATGPPPLVGRLPVRLDDAFEPAVFADVVLDLRSTAGGAELALRAGTADTPPSVENVAPYDVRVTGCTVRAADGTLTPTAVDVAIAGGQSASLAAAAGADVVTVVATLDLPDDVPPALMEDVVAFRTTDVQAVHHLLGVNATGVLGAAGTVTALTVTITLDDLPAVAVPALALARDRPVDRASIDIPVQRAFGGLAATVTLAVTRDAATPPASVTLRHDFVAAPILVLTADQLTGA